MRVRDLDVNISLSQNGSTQPSERNATRDDESVAKKKKKNNKNKNQTIVAVKKL